MAVVVDLPSMCEAQGYIPSTEKNYGEVYIIFLLMTNILVQTTVQLIKYFWPLAIYVCKHCASCR